MMKTALLGLLLLVAPLWSAQAQTWCPVTQPALLEERTVPFYDRYGDQISVTLRGRDGELVGQVVTVPADADVLLSDDGQRLAYVQPVDAFNYALGSIGTATGTVKTLVTPADMAALRPESDAAGYGPLQMAWIPGTDRIAFSTRVYYDSDGIFEPTPDDLWTVDALSGEIVTVLPPGAGGQLTLSSDGRYAVIEGRDTLKLVDLTSGEAQAVAVEGYQAVGLGHTVAYPPLLWQADSFLIAVPGADPYAQHDGIVSIWRVPLDSLQAEQVGTHNAFFLSFAFAPDGTKAAYWRTSTAQSNRRTLVVASVDGREQLEITTADMLDFERWLLDSEHVVYRLRFADGGWQSIVADVCTTAD